MAEHRFQTQMTTRGDREVTHRLNLAVGFSARGRKNGFRMEKSIQERVKLSIQDFFSSSGLFCGCETLPKQDTSQMLDLGVDGTRIYFTSVELFTRSLTLLFATSLHSGLNFSPVVGTKQSRIEV